MARYVSACWRARGHAIADMCDDGGYKCDMFASAVCKSIVLYRTVQ